MEVGTFVAGTGGAEIYIDERGRLRMTWWA
jgi:hypothetical protein